MGDTYNLMPMGNINTCNVRNKGCPWGDARNTSRRIPMVYDCLPMGNLYTCNVRNKGCPWGDAPKIYDQVPMGKLHTCIVRNKECPWGTPGTRPEEYLWVSPHEVKTCIYF